MSTTATVAMSTDTERKPVTLHRLRRMLAEGEKIVMLTAYDASFARLAAAAGIGCAGGGSGPTRGGGAALASRVRLARGAGAEGESEGEDRP